MRYPRDLSAAERGASAVGFVLVAPVLILMVMTVMQFVLLSHTEHVLSSAARSTLGEAVISNNSSQAQAHGNAIVASAGGLITNPQIQVSDFSTSRQIVVTGSAKAYRTVPFLSVEVNVTYSGPADDFVS